MKNIFNVIILIFILIITFAVCFKNTQSNSLSLKNIDINDITSISIKTQMVSNHPEEKILKDKDDIKKVIEFLKNFKGKKIQGNVNIKGWGYLIVFKGYNISLSGNRIKVNNISYKTESLKTDEFTKVYDSLKTKGHKCH